MNVKMILTDLDGTLICSDGSISERTKEVLKRCQNHGIYVVIATARYWIGAELPDYETAAQIANKNHCRLQRHSATILQSWKNRN